MAEDRIALMANIPDANKISLDSISVINKPLPPPTIVHGTLHPNYISNNSFFKNPLFIGGVLVVAFILLKK